MAKINPKSAIPLPLQIKEDIRTRIISGQMKPEDKLPSETTLADEYGVSRMTSRQALIELINESILYRIPGKGTFVAGRRDGSNIDTGLTNRLIMLITPDLQQSFYYQIIRSTERTLTKNGYELILRSAREDPLEERKCLQKILEGAVKGLILIAEKYSVTNLDILQKVRRRIPIVMVDVAVPGLATDLVISDDQKGGFLITEHLIESGHKNILHLSGPEGDSSAEKRLSGYQTALKKHNLKYQTDLVRFTEWHVAEGYSETKKFFLNGANKEKVTAIFACNDEVACGAFKALSDLGIKVPSNVALAGYGNLDICRFLEIPLTTVDQSTAEMGQTASQMILNKISGQREFKESKTVVIPTKLVIRQSCGLQK
ncbi:MAG: GntR family transcriptional regulator [Candidatus Omnitrophota bacterium]